MIYLAAFLSIATFVIALWLFGIISAAAKAVEISWASMKILRDSALSDEDKERTLQRASLTLLRSFVSITGRTAAALAASMLPMLAFDTAGLARVSDVANFLITWEAIVLISVILTVVYVVGKRY